MTRRKDELSADRIGCERPEQVAQLSAIRSSATTTIRVVVAADAAAQRDLRHRVEAALAGKVFDQRRTIESELAKLSCKQWRKSVARCAGGEDRALVFHEAA
jgi:hypothetical protein